MKVLMVGVDETTKGGMWAVVENYLQNPAFCKETGLKYVPTSITGSKLKRILFTAKAFLKLLFLFFFKDYDIVHIHMSERGSVYRKNIVINMAKRSHCKVVLHMHGAEFENWYQASDQKTQKFICSVLDKADRILILGDYWKEFIRSLAADPDKVEVVYNAVPVPKANRYHSDAKNLLFLGVVGQRKGIYDLLHAMKTIDEELEEEVKLLVYGPDFENNILSEIQNLELENRVKYLGWLSKDDKPEIFKNVAVNILPSYNEGLPMTILETMAFGIPNISTNVAAIPEAVNEANGRIINPGDVDNLAKSILEFMNDEKIRSEKSIQAFTDAKSRFSVEKHLEQLLKIYNSLR